MLIGYSITQSNMYQTNNSSSLFFGAEIAIVFFESERKHVTFLTSVSPFVDFQVFRSGKHFSTSGEGTWKWFLSGVYSDMIYQFVFGFERFSFSDALFPKTNMI